jgi:hypothetical protein
MSTIKVDNLQTTGGAGLYPARAWAVLDGTGTVSVTDGENVSSLTDNGTGLYTMNYATNFTVSTYSWVGITPDFPDGTKCSINIRASDSDGNATTKTTSATQMRMGQSNQLVSRDRKNVCITVVP